MPPLHAKKLRFTLLDVVIALALLAAAVWVSHRVRDGLNYRWEWGALPQYLFRFDSEQGRWLPNVQRVRVVHGSNSRRMRVCTSCLKAGKVQKA